MMQIKNSIVLITGASGGIGSSLLEEFISRKANKVYATDINTNNLNTLKEKYPEKVIPIKLDITNINDVIACREMCADTDILINNAGVECAIRFLGNTSLKASQFEMAVNYFGVHNLCHAFWNTLKQKQSACIVNMLSIGSFAIVMKLGTYCASKAAAHFLTQALREESKGTSINIFGVYPGYVDTAMTQNIDVEKATPQQIAVEICNGIENKILDIFPDKMSKSLVSQVSHLNKIFSDFTQ